MAWHVPAPDQHWPFTQAPTQSVSVPQLLRMHPELPAHVKFAGQLVAVHVAGTQCPVVRLQLLSPVGVEGQSVSRAHFATQWALAHWAVTQTRLKPASPQL
jgi:hypothetical protein